MSKLIHDSFPSQGEVIPSYQGGSDLSPQSMYNQSYPLSGGAEVSGDKKWDSLNLKSSTKRGKYSRYDGW